jgi:hypothetical protein
VHAVEAWQDLSGNGTAVDPEDDKELVSAICTALDTALANVRFKVQAFTEHLQALESNLTAPDLCAPYIQLENARTVL